jgi:hypothetical protein
MLAANEAAIAWAAGLFEGEGCIFLRINKEKGKYYPHLSLSMCDEDVVKKFAITVDRPNITGPYYCKSQPLWKPRYQWFCGKKKGCDPDSRFFFTVFWRTSCISCS